MRFADAETVHRYLDYPYLMDALQAAHRDAPPTAEHMVSNEPGGGENLFVTLVGWKRAKGIAVKMVGVFPENLSLEPPQASVQGLVALFDPGTGAPQLVADGEAMTFRKTAADSGLGARLLSREDSETLLMVGAGGLAPHLVQAHLAARPSLRKIRVWNRTQERAEALIERLEVPGVDVGVARDLDSAVARADIISCATMAQEPLVKGELLKPGAHLDLVGAYRPDMREADDAAMARGTVFVDCREGMKGNGELSRPVDRGVITWGDVKADFYELAQGDRPGRQTEEEITVFKNVGGGHLDLFAAIALKHRLA
ncbi:MULTISPECIES: ornithine cyclodeaminase family protein [Sulfitobacter]|uniref:ornithine cyclodeaminase family protein n=1 Tax=Sulfitobacter TaxID=60136 RepID=UPI000E77E9CC|nr:MULTISPECIES: ornithine cyclodeaminase [Sulfitobacter]AYE88103.1 ornithine cyclodeaminase [Sulfitobacter sp. D7]MCZ4368267.1 ornithine cyclodeaminase [Sulfitobacter dubius]